MILLGIYTIDNDIAWLFENSLRKYINYTKEVCFTKKETKDFTYFKFSKYTCEWIMGFESFWNNIKHEQQYFKIYNRIEPTEKSILTKTYNHERPDYATPKRINGKEFI